MKKQVDWLSLTLTHAVSNYNIANMLPIIYHSWTHFTLRTFAFRDTENITIRALPITRQDSLGWNTFIIIGWATSILKNYYNNTKI